VKLIGQKLAEKSVGKDTMTGHWENSGQIVTHPLEFFQMASQRVA